MSRLLTETEATQFEELLSVYSLREDGLARFEASNFAIIAGPAGAGKDTLRNGLMSAYPDKYQPIISTTTRPSRQGEQEGITYHFSEIEDVRRGLGERRFFQAELVHNQQVSCLDISEIQKLRPGQWGLSILITQTEQKLHAIKPDIKTIFLIPPDLTTLMGRMQAERSLDNDEISRRLEAARNEIESALDAEHYYCLVSDTVEHVLDSADAYLQSDIRNPEQDKQARAIMRQTLDTLNDW
jgi:guanylate kinase